MTPIDPPALLALGVRPAIDHLRMGGGDAEAQLLGTAATESALRHWRQIRGPALGLWQMEPATHEDIWRSWLQYRELDRARVVELIPRTVSVAGGWPVDLDELAEVMAEPIGLIYSAAMARIHYRRVPEPLPAAADIVGQARYWKRHYNTARGRGTVEHYIESVRRLL